VPAERYFQGFLGYALLFLGRHNVEGLHVMKPVGQFDEDDPYVFRHGHQHFA